MATTLECINNRLCSVVSSDRSLLKSTNNAVTPRSHDDDNVVVLIKMFSFWFLTIFNDKIHSEKDSELTSKYTTYKFKVYLLTACEC